MYQVGLCDRLINAVLNTFPSPKILNSAGLLVDAQHSGPESGQFVRKLFFAQKCMGIPFGCYIFALFAFFPVFDAFKILFTLGLFYYYK